jgi:predicted transcriptional regulator
MSTVILEVQRPEDVFSEFVRTWKTGEGHEGVRIAFATPELLWKVLTAKRWEVLKALRGLGPVSIRETARRVSRDVKAVHRDVSALLAAGLLQRTDAGKIEFPFEAVKVEFVLEAA